MNDNEKSASGNRIYRHEAKEREWQLPENGSKNLEVIENHLKKHVGKVETVYHEILSDLIHLDILIIPSNANKPYHTLVTCGVSEMPMTVPQGVEDFKYAELMINLPAKWPLLKDYEVIGNNENNHWPIRWLKHIGRLPHDYDTWIGWGHTIPNGDPAVPIANTKFTGVMLTFPYWFGPDFFQLEIEPGEKINFYHMVPLYKEEMDLKLAKGAEIIDERIAKDKNNFILNTKRKNVAKKKRWL